MINFYWHEAIVKTCVQQRLGLDNIPVVIGGIIPEVDSSVEMNPNPLLKVRGLSISIIQ
jgi:hypothetical protein